MISSVQVKYGRPIIQIPFRMLRSIAYVALGLNIISIIYIFEMLSMATHVKKNLGDYINLIYGKGSTLSSIMVSAGLLMLPSNICNAISLSMVFRLANKFFDMLLFVDVILSIFLILVLLILTIAALVAGSESAPSGIEGLLNAMENYSNDSLIKGKIDTMQVKFQCCGARNYSDWYYIDWYDKNFIKKGNVPVVGEAPFSCCSIRSPYPCIHHGIESGAGAYKYSMDANFSLSVTGCFESIQDKKYTAGWQIARYILCLMLIQITATIPLRLIQTAHIERGKFDKEGYLYTSWLLGCYVGKKRVIPEPPPVPPLPPELMD